MMIIVMAVWFWVFYNTFLLLMRRITFKDYICRFFGPLLACAKVVIVVYLLALGFRAWTYHDAGQSWTWKEVAQCHTYYVEPTKGNRLCYEKLMEEKYPKWAKEKRPAGT